VRLAYIDAGGAPRRGSSLCHERRDRTQPRLSLNVVSQCRAHSRLHSVADLVELTGGKRGGGKRWWRVKEAGGDRCDIVNERWSNREAYKDNKRTGYDEARVSRTAFGRCARRRSLWK